MKFQVCEWGQYRTPKIAVRIGDGFPKPTDYLCGMRQGYSASPILFDFYINGLFKGIQGVYVPGLTSRVPGLLFKDDSVLLAESEADMKIELNKITDLSNTWEMTVNSSKCGEIKVAGHQSSDLILKDQNIPKTDQYTYLDYIMNNKWDFSRAIKNNKLKAKKTFYAAYSFLKRRIVPGIQGVYVPGLTSRVPGLLFKDDSVLLAESEADMKIELNKITDLSNTWEMTVNSSKCGEIKVAGHQSSDLILKDQNIPKTDQYTYLDYIMNNKWDFSRAIKNNKLKAKKTFYAAYSFLKRRIVPVSLKIKFINSVLMPIGCYGGETFGMSIAKVKPIQAEIIKRSEWLPMLVILPPWNGFEPS
ncbi:RNA-directed DNA polymerase from mobile element jockey [Smittium mucronatum]|uniref:RNA-directed DNA polymerase from mobile element jockey n=1 Tax=Smittium mucronatum TaxID=133383 RepID=A0A1R0H8P4_9FUNG|nr:RNA-directed DNA polymerase from mobile element jockey [Smittium mucronatum]